MNRIDEIKIALKDPKASQEKTLQRRKQIWERIQREEPKLAELLNDMKKLGIKPNMPEVTFKNGQKFVL